MSRSRKVLPPVSALLLSLGLLFAASFPLAAQTTTSPLVAQTKADLPSDGADLDYAAWESLATRAEKALELDTTTADDLDQLRAQIADWREALLVAQNTNSSRITTLREQIAALGPAPAEGETEAAEIAGRRTQLTEQLVRLQAPGLAADEAYRRADGLIREIDVLLRERQADELLQLLPTPLNPANWPTAITSLTQIGGSFSREILARIALPSAREALINNLPAIVLLLAISLALTWRGRLWIESLVHRLIHRSSARGLRTSALILSLGQIAIPVIGVSALSRALELTSMFGIVGTILIESLPTAGVMFFTTYWLAGRLFPVEDELTQLPLPDDRRAEARFLILIFGVVMAAEAMRTAVLDHITLTEAAQSVLAFPALVIAGFVLWRLGHLLLIAAKTGTETEDGGGFKHRIIGLLGRGALIIGVIGPLLAAIGYIPAATAMIFPALNSLGLVGLLLILQILVTDIYVFVTRSEDDGEHALLPVLVGFGLVLASLPLFALIWGARLADLTELWARMREGFQMGDTRISPTDFLFFALVFALGYTATRLFQGALKATVLPRTKLDQGAQNAFVSGVGYVGIFLAALIAINSTGIDLSGLAIVAGALSVGIGFGLQNIVSNFVSGIILLIERPVSEGDWIEVSGVQGIVKAISVRSTRIQTFDRTDVIVPNSDLVAGQVTNWTRFNLSGRLIVPVGVAYGSDTRKVARILQEIAEAQPLAILNPPPVVVLAGFGADSIDFEIRIILRDVNFSLSTRSEINHEIARRFAEEGVEIPFAQRDVTLRNAGEIADILKAFRGTHNAPAPTETRNPDAPLPRDQFPGEGLQQPSDDER